MMKVKITRPPKILGHYPSAYFTLTPRKPKAICPKCGAVIEKKGK